MRQLIALTLAALVAGPLSAQETAAVALAGDTMTDATPEFAPLDAKDVSLDDFLWEARPIVVFADSEADPRFAEQMELLADRPDELTERDVVVITDTDRSEPSEIRRKLRPRGFMLVLIGKDGGVKLRKPAPWDVREITRVIDKMPLRQQEIRDR